LRFVLDGRAPTPTASSFAAARRPRLGLGAALRATFAAAARIDGGLAAARLGARRFGAALATPGFLVLALRRARLGADLTAPGRFSAGPFTAGGFDSRGFGRRAFGTSVGTGCLRTRGRRFATARGSFHAAAGNGHLRRSAWRFRHGFPSGARAFRRPATALTRGAGFRRCVRWTRGGPVARRLRRAWRRSPLGGRCSRLGTAFACRRARAFRTPRRLAGRRLRLAAGSSGSLSAGSPLGLGSTTVAAGGLRALGDSCASARALGGSSASVRCFAFGWCRPFARCLAFGRCPARAPSAFSMRSLFARRPLAVRRSSVA
jgi:hypothetical protein